MRFRVVLLSRKPTATYGFKSMDGRGGKKVIIKPEIRLLKEDGGRRTRRDKPNELPMGEEKFKILK